VQRNIEKALLNMCGIAMEASYPAKKVANPPNLRISPLSHVKPPTMCDKYYPYPERDTWCCMYNIEGYCYALGCYPLDFVTHYDDH
jgi:hypothetical protein